MKIPLLITALLLLAASASHARDYGVSSRPAGRGTVYTNDRGGSAYVGPRGVAAQGADGDLLHQQPAHGHGRRRAVGRTDC